MSLSRSICAIWTILSTGNRASLTFRLVLREVVLEEDLKSADKCRAVVILFCVCQVRNAGMRMSPGPS